MYNGLGHQSPPASRRFSPAFSLVELMIVIVIMGILAAIAIPVYYDNVDRAILAESDAAMGSIRNYLVVYYGTNGMYSIQLFDAYVIGKSWNEIKPGELNGQFFRDSSFYYYCWDGINYFLIAQKGQPNPLWRTLDQNGDFESWPNL